MMRGTRPDACRRPGCPFSREYVKRSDGSGRLQRHCSVACRVWLIRAKRADREGDETEALELMRLSALLDARRNPRVRVPGVLRNEEAA